MTMHFSLLDTAVCDFPGILTCACLLLEILFHGQGCRNQNVTHFKEWHNSSSTSSSINFTLTFNRTILFCKYSLQVTSRVLTRFHFINTSFTMYFSSYPHSDLVFHLNFTVVTFLSPCILYNLSFCFHKCHI